MPAPRASTRRWSAALALLLLLGPGAARAWPVDVYVDLRPGLEDFRRLSAVEWVEVEDPSIATAEIMESGELLLTGKAPGRTLLLLYAEGKFAVWRLRVGAPPPKPEAVEAGAAQAKKACRDLKLEGSSEAPELAVTVVDERCRAALLELFKADGFTARRLELTFELPALQAQLASIQAGLAQLTKEKVEAHYVGAGLVLEGRLSRREHRKALWEIFKRSVGRPAVDDRIELLDEKGAADGGAR